MTIQKLEIAPIGPVTFSQTRRARRLSITIRPPGEVRVAYPVRVSHKKAKEYLQTHLQWVMKHISQFQKSAQAHHSTIVENAVDPQSAKSKVFLKLRLRELAAQFGFSYNRVFIRNQKTRWGSCSEVNNINLNMHLINLKPDLRDYVLLHELVHTRIKNHSKKFWAELDKYTNGNAKKLDKELRKHQLGYR